MKKLIIVLIFVLIFVGVVLAFGPPTIPVTYTGNLYHEGEIILGDFNVTAFIGNIMSSGKATGGEYEIDVSSCCGVNSGEINFFVNGVEANEHPTYHGEEDYGKVTYLDLTFDEEIPETSLCGDGDIDSGEQCDSDNINYATCENVIGTGWTGTVTCTSACAFDISGCSYTGTSSGSSSSSGSSTSHSSGGGGGSSGSSGGMISDTSAPTSSGISNENEEQTIGLNSNDKSGSGITGAVTKVLDSKFEWATLFVAALVIILEIIFVVVQAKRKSPDSTPQNL